MSDMKPLNMEFWTIWDAR